MNRQLSGARSATTGPISSRRRCGVLVACILITLGAGWQGAARGSEPQAAVARLPIAGSRLDEIHTGVLGLRRSRQAKAGLEGSIRSEVVCSGVLLAPNLVLTARHCIADTMPGPVLCGRSPLGREIEVHRVMVSNDVLLSEEGVWYGVSRVFLSPEGSDACGFDIALLLLDQNVPATVATPAVPNLDQGVRRGDRFSALGYGALRSDAGPKVRTAIVDREVSCSGNQCGPVVADSEFMGTAGPCRGDSGGPALDADDRVIGALSRGSDPCDTPIYVSLFAFRDFISEVTMIAAQRGEYPPPFWLTQRMTLLRSALPTDSASRAAPKLHPTVTPARSTSRDGQEARPSGTAAPGTTNGSTM